MTRKTAIIVISAAALLIILGLIVFFIWFREPGGGGGRPGGDFPDVGEPAFPPGDTTPSTVLPETPAARLVQLSKVPVAGAILGVEGGEPTVRYIESATGHSYKVNPASPRPERITNTTIPKVYEAKWQKSGSGVILRYLKDDGETIETYYGVIKKARTGLPAAPGTAQAGEGSELQGTFLASGIKEIALSPDGRDVLYLREENGGGALYTSRLGSDARRRLLLSPLREWALLWPTSGEALIFTKPSVASPGFLSTLSMDTGHMETILSASSGLTVGAGTGPRLLVGESLGSSFSLKVFNTDTRTTTTAPLQTLPEKCVFSPTQPTVIYCGVPRDIPRVAYPDAWYQGIVALSDELWMADLETGNVQLLSDLTRESGAPLDLIEIAVSDDASYLIFKNKRDSLLWSYKLRD